MLEQVPLLVECLSSYGDLPVPSYESAHAAGLDLRAAEDTTIMPREKALVPTGLKIAVAPGYEAQIRPRSGLALKTPTLIPNSPGTIDADYRGEVKIIMWNLGSEDFIIKRGDRIAQMVISPVVKVGLQLVKSLSQTERGAGGFGSTGTH